MFAKPEALAARPGTGSYSDQLAVELADDVSAGLASAGLEPATGGLQAELGLLADGLLTDSSADMGMFAPASSADLLSPLPMGATDLLQDTLLTGGSGLGDLDAQMQAGLLAEGPLSLASDSGSGFGQRLAFDQANLDTTLGVFAVGSSGQVEIDFLFDGGAHTGELAIFSLAGMDGLDVEAFTQVAARRALSGNDGQIVIADQTEGAQYGGELGERDRNRGKAAATKVVNLPAGTQFAFMLVPNGTVADMLLGSGQRPLFSIAALNPDGKTQFAQAAEGIFAVNDSQVSRSNADFNDLVFEVKGANGTATAFAQLVSPAKNWLLSPVAQPFLRTPKFSRGDSPIVDSPIVDSGLSLDPLESIGTDQPTATPTDGPTTDSPTGAGEGQDLSTSEPDLLGDALTLPAGVVSAVSNKVAKFKPSSSRSEIEAAGALKVTLGTQTIYIGTQQVSSINQNPIIRSFDSANPANNWTRTDFEKTGADGRGLGIVWTGKALYGVFSVDGTQGKPQDDFRRASGGATQSWLRSYGPGGGGKVAVLGQIDPATGNLLKAAYLSAVLKSGKTNSLSVSGVTVNGAGNLVVSAKSFSSPRRPDGKAMTKVGSGGSPFDYTAEITPDLTKVVRTAAKGWK